MAEERTLAAVRYLKGRLRRSGLRVSKAVLFGSHARGEATPDSDIDVAVISEGFRGKDLFERGELVGGAHRAAVRKFLLPFDIVTLTPEEFESEESLVAQFAKEGVVL